MKSFYGYGYFSYFEFFFFAQLNAQTNINTANSSLGWDFAMSKRTNHSAVRAASKTKGCGGSIRE